MGNSKKIGYCTAKFLHCSSQFVREREPGGEGKPGGRESHGEREKESQGEREPGGERESQGRETYEESKSNCRIL